MERRRRRRLQGMREGGKTGTGTQEWEGVKRKNRLRGKVCRKGGNREVTTTNTHVDKT